MLKSVWWGASNANQAIGRLDIAAPTRSQLQGVRPRPKLRHPVHTNRIGNIGADNRDEPAAPPAHKPAQRSREGFFWVTPLTVIRKAAVIRNRQIPYAWPIVPKPITTVSSPISIAAIKAALKRHLISGIRSKTK